MPEPVKSKRSYDSTRRRQQASATRRDILEAAQRLFEQHGYAGTTMAAVAAEAGVALKTVYLAFETKSGLLRAVWHLLLRGDEDDVPVGERRWYQDVIEEPDPERQLRLVAQNSRMIKERAGTLLGVIRNAASADPDIKALWSRIQSDFYDNQRSIVKALQAHDGLRPGLDVTAPLTSSGRSTTQTCGNCSSASAAGRPNSTSSGSETRSARSCCAPREPDAARRNDREDSLVRCRAEPESAIGVAGGRAACSAPSVWAASPPCPGDNRPPIPEQGQPRSSTSARASSTARISSWPR